MKDYIVTKLPGLELEERSEPNQNNGEDGSVILLVLRIKVDASSAP
jgi:hypothetical protein